MLYLPSRLVQHGVVVFRYYWLTGRVDDVMNCSGHRIGTAEIEAALGVHEAVSESAVVGFPHEIKGEVLQQ